MSSLNVNDKIIITGGAGLVGQNLAHQLAAQGYNRLVILDKHPGNLKLLSEHCPGVETVVVDLADPGPWEETFANAAVIVHLAAQICGKDSDIFVRNNIRVTETVIDAARRAGGPYFIHVSSSVVNSVADDDYTRTKTRQEELISESGLPYCILRPTLMFGWFDPKHLGWLSRFLKRFPVFPIPGNGRFMRQPLYVRDFCRALIHVAEEQPRGRAYDIVGQEEIDYVDIIRTIRAAAGAKTLLLHLPIPVFRLLLKIYSVFSADPPFTADQLDALIAGDEFTGVDMQQAFNVTPTPFARAITETFTAEPYCRVVIAR